MSFMDYFSERLETYEKVLDILDGVRSHPSVDAEYASISQLIQQVHFEVSSLQTKMQETKQLISREKDQIVAIQMLKKRMIHLKNNRHLFTVVDSEQEPTINDQTNMDYSCKGREQLQDTTNSSLSGFPLQSCDNNKSLDVSRRFFASTPIPPRTPKAQKDMEVAISYVSNSEFMSVPQYMRGRLRHDEINSFVSIFNAALNEKFSLLNKPRNTLKSRKEQDLVLLWKEQRPEVKHEHYLTAQDFASLQGLKLSKRDFSIITVLRHLQRVKEVRVKKATYFVALF